MDRAELKRPVPSGTMIDCVKQVMKVQKLEAGAWAYDGRANIFAGAQLYKGQQASKGEAVHFQIALPQVGRPNPKRYECAFPTLYSHFVFSSVCSVAFSVS